ncbi:hypothetical protein Tcan_04715 [Toxocara canis]|uniref:Uncharacterized protein n=1 Tax=Toxocara canis TaxID=6265 RepID=A0A0B2VD65_TOXCA|nr:hypothetical protein Tcan_04715 [Toxocara canis]
MLANSESVVVIILISVFVEASCSGSDPLEGYFTSLSDSPLDTVYSATNGLRSWHDDPFSFDPFAPIDIAKRFSLTDLRDTTSAAMPSAENANQKSSTSGSLRMLFAK